MSKKTGLTRSDTFLILIIIGVALAAFLALDAIGMF